MNLFLVAIGAIRIAEKVVCGDEIYPYAKINDCQVPIVRIYCVYPAINGC
jgi:hypothetical protein